MSEVLSLDHLGIKADGPTLSMSLAKGQSLAIVGPGGAGKSRFLRTLIGLDRPAQGTVNIREEIRAPAGLQKRLRLQSLARQHPESASILAAAGLLEDHPPTLSDLSPSQITAAELVPALSHRSGLVALDGHLDRLDPWTLPVALERLRKLLSSGLSVLATTNRAELLRFFDVIVVLMRHEVRFAGNIDGLLRLGVGHELRVETQKQQEVRALTDPFEVSVTETPSGLRLHTPEGQELTAKMLLQGYGDVRFVIHRPPTIEEALRSIR